MFILKNKKIILILQLVILLALLAWQFIFLMQPINLATADLGRHLKNGAEVLAGHWPVLFTNFYSFSAPDFPFINHHWFSGVIFYGLWQLINFSGLHLFYLLFSFLTLLIFWRLASRYASWKIVAVFAFLLMPLLSDRAEIRPEVFTYFLFGVFWWLLARHYHQGRKQKLWLPPLLMVVWVNLHIGFIFGLLLIGVFLCEWLLKYFWEKYRHQPSSLSLVNIKQLFLIFFSSCLAALLNPALIQGILAPFNIFKNYGYRIVENQSVWFLEKWGMNNPNFLLLKIFIILLVVSFILVLIFNRRRFLWSHLLLAISFSVLALLAIRNFSHFGLVALPILSYNFYVIFIGLQEKISLIAVRRAAVLLGFLSLIFIFCYQFDFLLWKIKNNDWHLGVSVSSRAADFLKEHQLVGPIFNNYDLGGYLIFYLSPQEKVFVDNRPEAYPANFLQDVYVAAQEKEEIWQQLVQKYQFNLIVFYWHDLTPWAQKFLITRIDDAAWAPVYVDGQVIIFLKNNQTNQKMIKKYQIPRQYFSTQ